MNRNLTEKNAAAVNKLVQDNRLKAMWQAVREQHGVKKADTYISNRTCQPLSTVRAARYYW